VCYKYQNSHCLRFWNECGVDDLIIDLIPLAVKSIPRGSLLRLFIKKKSLRSEIQNSLTISGLLPHKLVLKVNCTFY
jgi:hypothetical protein